MTTQTIVISAYKNKNVSIELRDLTDHSLIASSLGIESPEGSGVYVSNFIDIPAAGYLVLVLDTSTGEYIWSSYVVLLNKTARFRCSDSLINDLADGILMRSVASVEGDAPEHSLATLILSALEWSISGNILTIKRTDGTTVHYVKNLTTSSFGNQVITGAT